MLDRKSGTKVLANPMRSEMGQSFGNMFALDLIDDQRKYLNPRFSVERSPS